MNKLLKTILLVTIMNSSCMADDIWIFFDLGNTVINVKDKHSFHYFSGTRKYIQELKNLGYKVGAISNIPESFGQNYDEKLKTLMSYVSQNWIEQKEFEWGLFDKIYLPLSNEELKPSPILFKRALEDTNFKPSLFISETPLEVEQAMIQGYAGHVFKENDAELYINISNVESYIKVNSRWGK